MIDDDGYDGIRSHGVDPDWNPFSTPRDDDPDDIGWDDGSEWIGNGVLDRFLEDESLFGEFLRTPVSEGGVEPLVVEPPHVVVEVGA